MGRVILFLLISFVGFSQATKMNIQGTDYHFVGDSFSEYRSPGDYSTIVEDDLVSYVKVFIRDAIVDGQELGLDLTNDVRRVTLNYRNRVFEVRNNSISFTPNSFYGTTSGIQGASYRDGTPQWIILISRFEWDREPAIEKRRIAYHELGHALLHKEHSCKTTEHREIVRYHTVGNTVAPAEFRIINSWAVMATGACRDDTKDLWETLNYTCQEGLAPFINRNDCVGGGEFDFRIWRDRLTHLYNNAPTLGVRRYDHYRRSSKSTPEPIICRRE